MQSFVSARLLLFIASLIIFAASIFVIRKNSRPGKGGDDFVRRKKLKTFAYLMLFPAMLLFGLAALNDQMARDDNVLSIDPVAAAAAQAYVPPVLPVPTQTLLAPKDTWKTRLPGTNGDSYTAPASRTASTPSALVATPTASPAQADPSQPLANVEHVETDLAAASSRIATNPQDADAYNTRGNLYAAMRDYDSAARDYQNAVTYDPTNSKAKFNLAEMSFVQKKYDVAKTGFAALEKDPELDDLAAYKAFLCDLLAGQLDAAGKELDAFNQVGANASYYFANVAWSINHHKPDEARDWLQSASRIYPQDKLKLYATSLFEMGYLPLPPGPGSN